MARQNQRMNVQESASQFRPAVNRIFHAHQCNVGVRHLARGPNPAYPGRRYADPVERAVHFVPGSKGAPKFNRAGMVYRTGIRP
jgi:hypothetical protein